MLNVRRTVGICLFAKTAKRLLISRSAEANIVQQIVVPYDIRTASLEKPIMCLNGGNQQKAIIGRAMRSLAKVLIFDEPTKGIDAKAKNDVYHLLKRLAEKEQLGIILVSSELHERLTARMLGINVNRIRIICFMLNGFLASLAGILMVARLGSSNAC